MLITCDGTPLFRREDGVGRYTSQILRALVAGCHETTWQVIGFRDDRRKPCLIYPGERVQFEWLPVPRRLAGLMYKVSGGPSLRSFLKRTPDFAYYPNFVDFPRLDGIPFAVVIHDLAHIDVPTTVEQKNRSFLTRRISKSLQRSALVVTPSEFVANSVRANFPQLQSEIAVVQPGVDATFHPASFEQVAAAARKYGLPKEYILFVGSLQPRKNLDLLLSAYKMLPEELRKRHPLVLAGARGWQHAKTAEMIERMRIGGMSVVLPGFVDDADLPAIYSGASVFVFPSLYEGFGIPPLEAMACGTPVISSRKTALPEVVGDAAAGISGLDSRELADILISILSDDEHSALLVEAGFERVRQFTWQKSASTMLAAMTRTGLVIR